MKNTFKINEKTDKLYRELYKHQLQSFVDATYTKNTNDNREMVRRERIRELLKEIINTEAKAKEIYLLNKK